MDEILRNVIKRITPSSKEREEVESLLKRILNVTDKLIKPKFERTIAGSFIRDTWLRDKKEIDLFILFPVSYSREELEKKGLELGREIIKKLKGKYEIAYAEHPYVKGKIDEFGIDIVPCYKVESASKIKSAVDRTPFHNRYIMRNLKPEMSKEVRLLKQFCKAMGVYGSDIKTLGFSGYLCELLIIHYKTFKNLVFSASKWEPGELIDLERHCKIKNPRIYFRNQPLIVIDPTDPKRNVAASLSSKNFMLFVKMCEKFVNNPSEKFFEMEKSIIKKHTLRKIIEDRGTNFVVIEMKRPNVVDDVLWSQLRKTSKRLERFLEDNEFKVLTNEVWSDEKKSYLIFEMEVWSLPPIRKVVGPPVFSKKHSKQFISKYKGGKVYVRGNIWMADVKRDLTRVDLALKHFLKRSEKKLREEGIRSYIAKSISKGFKLLNNKKILDLSERNQDFARFLRDCLEKGV
jgi:tRNA nucleotidyltransferase (CCA-adding enzyme)